MIQIAIIFVAGIFIKFFIARYTKYAVEKRIVQASLISGFRTIANFRLL